MLQIHDKMKDQFTKVSEMMKTSTFALDERKSYYYCKVGTLPVELGKHLLVSKDEHEITVVTSELEGLDLIEKNENEWLLLDFKPSTPYMKGTILLLAHAIFNSDSNILVISTYSRDYALVKRKDKEKVLKALAEIGLKKVE